MEEANVVYSLKIFYSFFEGNESHLTLEANSTKFVIESNFVASLGYEGGTLSRRRQTEVWGAEPRR